jgi:Carboxypeptidase regulatory-like domain/TonB dependent receptor/TonB-dependent Receptor Plug Domain
MDSDLNPSRSTRSKPFRTCWAIIALGLGFAGHLWSQTASTGALTGIVLDPSDAVVPRVTIRLVSQKWGETKFATSDDDGRFSFLLLPPGTYELAAKKVDFKPLSVNGLEIPVTEMKWLELRLQLLTRLDHAQVSTESPMFQIDTSGLGQVVNEKAVTSLPLVTRNFAQIAGLSPGVTVGVYNAGELGLGGTALSQIAQSNDGIFAHGMRSYDNSWQLDGISVSDVQSSGASSGGIPVPNPDAIQEFKVQTGLYDAAYGRYGGANISLITKMGGTDIHGTVFEFLRNEVFNADDFFRNLAAQPRPALKENQFGFSVGGPIKKQKLFFFGSYQGTRQINGVAAGQSRIACSASLREPPLTNDRSATALGKLFAGMAGAQGGVAVKSDGSNINPVALNLLNFKLSDGHFLIPNPQEVDSSKGLSIQGSSVFSAPCRFNEDQLETNADLLPSQKDQIAFRFFFGDDHQTVTFPGNFFNPTSNIEGFTSPSDPRYRVFSVALTHTFSGNSLNEMRVAYVRTANTTKSAAPFKWSDIGVAEGEMNNDNGAPNLNILGSVQLATAFPRRFAQNSFIFSDTVSIIRGAHAARFGGSITRLQDNFGAIGNGSFVEFLSWPDFLLGLNGSNNGTGTFSNVFASIDDYGLFDREYRIWEGSAFVQDDYKIGRNLTLNIGLRYERLGQFGDNLGRNSSFDIGKANANPPPSGSVDGYIVASNFPGTPPVGITRANNKFANNGAGLNALAPRIGFAWQILPHSSHLVLRGGYGIYYSRPTGQALFQSADGAPYSLLRLKTGSVNADATFQTPFERPFPTPKSFPLFPPYSPTSATTIIAVSPGFRPAMVQQFSVNVQVEPMESWLLDVGYVGTRGTHLMRSRSLNQAQQASVKNPIRGVTENTVANIPLRVPVMGVPADSLFYVEPEGSSWYNGLEVSLTKRLRHGLQFLASYTFSKALDTDGADINATSAGTGLTIGDQNSTRQRWGRASFDRTRRFVVGPIWTLPDPSSGFEHWVLAGWNLAAMVTIQSGNALTITDTNANNVLGISEDRAELTGRCAKNQLVRGGAIQSKLNGYFNDSCFTTPRIIGADGIGTAFGNSQTGIVDGPGQANLDLAVTKAVLLPWPREKSTVEIRAEFYNAFNHPQFSNPDTNFTSPTFGVISSTAVNSRVGQLALRLNY